MKKTIAVVMMGMLFGWAPVEAKEAKKDAAKAAEKVEAAETAKPTPTKDELAQRSLTGIQNQRAWVATLQKQLDGETAKLTQMEADHQKQYGALPKSS